MTRAHEVAIHQSFGTIQPREPTDADARLTEDLLGTLNEIVARQQAQIDCLTTEHSTLRNQMPTPDGGPLIRSLRDELSPQY
ncbi:MAG TPA: SlyX protein [Rhizobacter sp.]